jgi:hypothetical protein
MRLRSVIRYDIVKSRKKSESYLAKVKDEHLTL